MKRSVWFGLAVSALMVFATVGLALSFGGGRGGATVAFAQGSATATPAAPGNSPPTQGTSSDLLTTFWSSLASKLGTTVDDLKTKVAAAEKDAIEQGVTKGTLTRAQADTLEQRLTANGPTVDLFEEFHGGPGQAPGIGPHGPALGGIDVLEAEAKALNMTPSALTAQLQSGKTLADIAKAQNVDQAVVKQAIIDAAKAQIQREAQDGLITQAQADQKLSTLTPDQIDLTRISGFHGFGPGPRGSGKMPGSFWPGSF